MDRGSGQAIGRVVPPVERLDGVVSLHYAYQIPVALENLDAAAWLAGKEHCAEGYA